MTYEEHPRIELAHTPTPLERMENLEVGLGDGNGNLYVKRDDCTGLAMGGNKVRQLEYYLGEAVSQGADTIVITGAVQSNFVRTAAAAAIKCGMKIEIQLEERVDNASGPYRNSGNVLLDKILGAKIHSFPVGEDESASDKNLYKIAEDIKSRGGKPYVVPLGMDHPPIGAMGYIRMCDELIRQCMQQNIKPGTIIVGSGSGVTHAGILVGFRRLGSDTRVIGVCVRRSAELQQARVLQRAQETAKLAGCPGVIKEKDVIVTDDYLSPGYGVVNEGTVEAIKLAARCEALLVDPVYTGKALAGVIDMYRKKKFSPDENVIFIHTGGTPAIFGYQDIFDKFVE